MSDELLDPCPDPHALFLHYAPLYFDDALDRACVQWSSKRMTSCAGTCEYQQGAAVIKLSEPLLKFRPPIELKETLLHEMIHAWVYLSRQKDHGPGSRDGHGLVFQDKMKWINMSSHIHDQERPAHGYHITVRHSMHAEVDHYQTHRWECSSCGDLVKRAMNRPPQKADCRQNKKEDVDCGLNACHYHYHQRVCGGDYVKVAEPAGYKPKGKKGKRKASGFPSEGGRTTGYASDDEPEDEDQQPAPQPVRRPAKRPTVGGSGDRNTAITDFFRAPAGGERNNWLGDAVDLTEDEPDSRPVKQEAPARSSAQPPPGAPQQQQRKKHPQRDNRQEPSARSSAQPPPGAAQGQQQRKQHPQRDIKQEGSHRPAAPKQPKSTPKQPQGNPRGPVTAVDVRQRAAEAAMKRFQQAPPAAVKQEAFQPAASSGAPRPFQSAATTQAFGSAASQPALPVPMVKQEPSVVDLC